MLPDTNNSDMEDVCTEGTELTHVQDLSTSEQNPIIQVFQFRSVMTFVKDAECLGAYFLTLTELRFRSLYCSRDTL
jgi:hypothetical protein